MRDAGSRERTQRYLSLPPASRILYPQTKSPREGTFAFSWARPDIRVGELGAIPLCEFSVVSSQLSVSSCTILTSD
jgi:hypothetical protein